MQRARSRALVKSLVEAMFQLSLLFAVVPYLSYQNQRIIQGNRSLKRAFYQHGVSYPNFVVNKFRYLQESLLDSSCELDKPSECALACVNNPPCFSFNLALIRNKNKKLRCELLSEDKYRSPHKLVLSQEFHHFSIKVKKYACSDRVVVQCNNEGAQVRKDAGFYVHRVEKNSKDC